MDETVITTGEIRRAAALAPLAATGLIASNSFVSSAGWAQQQAWQ